MSTVLASSQSGVRCFTSHSHLPLRLHITFFLLYLWSWISPLASNYFPMTNYHKWNSKVNGKHILTIFSSCCLLSLDKELLFLHLLAVQGKKSFLSHILLFKVGCFFHVLAIWFYTWARIIFTLLLSIFALVFLLYVIDIIFILKKLTFTQSILSVLFFQLSLAI